jgi:hypothetical protein
MLVRLPRALSTESTSQPSRTADKNPAATGRTVGEMLKRGDHVYIDATSERGTVVDVHPHEILVRVKVAEGHEERKYALEDLRLDPTMSEVSEFYDH